MRWDTVIGELAANEQCFAVDCRGRVSTLLRSLE